MGFSFFFRVIPSQIPLFYARYIVRDQEEGTLPSDTRLCCGRNNCNMQCRNIEMAKQAQLFHPYENTTGNLLKVNVEGFIMVQMGRKMWHIDKRRLSVFPVNTAFVDFDL